MGTSRFSARQFAPKYIDNIYSLRCPVSMDVFYVGKTAKPKERLTQHVTEARSERNQKPKDLIIKEMIGLGKSPILRIIESIEVRTRIDEWHAAYREIYWIQFYKRIGWPLVNKVGTSEVELLSSEYSRFLKRVKSGSGVYLSDYQYGIDSNGHNIYDHERLRFDGFGVPPPTEAAPPPERSEYDPLQNWRFQHKMGFRYTVDDQWTYHAIYRDTDPNYYDDDY